MSFAQVKYRRIVSEETLASNHSYCNKVSDISRRGRQICFSSLILDNVLNNSNYVLVIVISLRGHGKKNPTVSKATILISTREFIKEG